MVIKFDKLFTRKNKEALTQSKATLFELKKEIDSIQQTIEKREDHLGNNLSSLSGEEKKSIMLELVNLQEQKRDKNRAKIELERDTREGKVSSSKEEEVKKLTPEEKIEEFLNQYNLKDKMVLDFEDLSIGQKMFVMENTKKRIVDIVKDDAETQYSEYYKEKMRANNKETKWLYQDIAKAIKVSKTGLKESILKESRMKNLESEAFESLIYGKKGEELLKNNLEILVNNAKEQEIAYDNQDGTTKIYYESYQREDGQEYTMEERQVIVDFNRAANEFRNIPYEWGQENKVGLGKNKNKKKYEETRASYEQAKIELLKLKSSKEDPNKKGSAMLEVSQIDSRIQMEQLLNTHPEFEKEIQNLERESGWREGVKDFKNFANNLTGKNMANRLFMAIGYTARGLSKGALAASNLGGLTFASSVAVGGTLGYFKGKLKGKEILEERRRGSRKGKKDDSEEKNAVVDAVNLNKRLDSLLLSVDRATTEEERTEALDRLKRRLDYSKEKIESGLVNFGNSKDSLENKFNFINKLNNAAVLSSSLEKTARKDIDQRLREYLTKRKDSINSKQKEFIKEQAKRGILVGAGFATIGYGIRWLGEHIGWWGPDGGKHLTEDSPTGPIPETRPEEIKIVPPPVVEPEKIEIEEPVTLEKNPDEVIKDDHGEGIHRFQEPKVRPRIEEVPEDKVVPEEKITNEKIVEEKIEKVPEKEVDPTSKVQGSKIVWTEGESGSPSNIKDPTQSVQGSKIEWKEGQSGSVENIKDRTQTIQGSNIRRGYMNTGEEETPSNSPEEKPEIPDEGHKEEPINKDPSTSTTVEEEYQEPITENGNKMGPPTEEEYMEPASGSNNPVEEKLTEKIEASSKVVVEEPQAEEYREPVSEVDYKEGKIPEEEYAEPAPEKTVEAVEKNLEQKPPKINIESDYAEPKLDTPPTSENPYGLTGPELQEVKTISDGNLSKVFGEKMNIWENIKNNPASSEITSEGITDEKKAFIKYLKKLKDVTGLEPTRETFVSRAETNSEYIKRALEYAIKQNKLSQLKL